MKILAFDTSTQQCSVAIQNNDKVLSHSLEGTHRHAEQLLPLIQTLLDKSKLALSQLDLITFTRGPGSFTGLRIGASLVQSLACVHNIPVAAISTLQCIAQHAYLRYGVPDAAVALDARMQQVYWCTYRLNNAQIMIQSSDESLINPEQISLNERYSCGAGSGWKEYADSLDKISPFVAQRYPDITPDANALLSLARYQYDKNLTINAQDALPIYLRDKVC